VRNKFYDNCPHVQPFDNSWRHNHHQTFFQFILNISIVSKFCKRKLSGGKMCKCVYIYAWIHAYITTYLCGENTTWVEKGNEIMKCNYSWVIIFDFVNSCVLVCKLIMHFFFCRWEEEKYLHTRQRKWQLSYCLN